MGQAAALEYFFSEASAGKFMGQAADLGSLASPRRKMHGPRRRFGKFGGPSAVNFMGQAAAVKYFGDRRRENLWARLPIWGVSRLFGGEISGPGR